MAKTEKELNDLKEKAEVVSKEPNELMEEELEQVSGGSPTHLANILE